MAYDCRYQPVTCKRCGRQYTCNPDDDYYAPAGTELTGPEDGYDLTCLIAVSDVPSGATVVVIREAGPS